MKIAALTAQGARIVATSDWVPVNARITPDSWRIEPDGSLTVDCDDLEPSWNGVLTGTDHGFPLYLTANGAEVAEDGLLILALDDAGDPCGDPLPFTPRRRTPVFDPAVSDATDALAVAAESVLGAWEGGDLAAAVRGLAARLEDLRVLLPACGRTPIQTPQTAATGDPT